MLGVALVVHLVERLFGAGFLVVAEFHVPSTDDARRAVRIVEQVLRAVSRRYAVRLAVVAEGLGVAPDGEAHAELQSRGLGRALVFLRLHAELDVLHESSHCVACRVQATTATTLTGFGHVNSITIDRFVNVLLQLCEYAHCFFSTMFTSWVASRFT